MNEDKATRYHRLRRRARLVSLASAAAALVALLVVDGGPALQRVAGAVAAVLAPSDLLLRPVTVATAATGLVMLLLGATIAPSYYAGFILERRYGLTRQTVLDWWRDYLKGSLLAACLGVTTAVVIYAAIDLSPHLWWLLAGAGLAILSALLVVVAPVAVLPLFYRVRPLERPELAARLASLAARAGTPVLGVAEWTLGEKSRAANAALVGIGPTRRILLSDTLLADYAVDEIEVIIAHELGHHVNGDLWRGIGLEAALATVALLAAHLVLVWGGPWLGVQAPGDLAGLPLLAAAAGVASMLTAPVGLAQSRRHERRADRFALELTGKSEAFVSAMRRLGAQNLADEQPPPLVEWLFHSHPSLSARIAFARRWALEHPAGQELGA